MKISTKGRYALRLMLDIASYGEEAPVRIKDIAARQEISAKYLEQIVSALVKAGYLKSIRGAQGGYQLMYPAREYTAGDILRVTEGSLTPVDCLEGDRNGCERADGCVTLRLWRELKDAINGVVDKYTLQDLLEWKDEMGSNYII